VYKLCLGVIEDVIITEKAVAAQLMGYLVTLLL
jgi:hypothetical protein